EEEREVIPLCRAEGLGIIPWSPLARGFLAGNRRGKNEGDTLRSTSDDFAHRLYYQPADYAVVDAVSAIAAKRGVSNAQASLACPPSPAAPPTSSAPASPATSKTRSPRCS